MAESYSQSLCDEEDEQNGSPKVPWSFGQGEVMDESSKLCVFQAPRWFPYHLLWFQDVLGKEKLKKKFFPCLIQVTAIREKREKVFCFCVFLSKR